MTRVLIVYGTTDGHTRTVAEAVGGTLRRQGVKTDVVLADGHLDVSPEEYDGIIVAASVQMGRFQRSVQRWVNVRAAMLNQKPTLFLAVCLAVLEKEPGVRQQIDDIVTRFLSQTRWTPSESRLVAGALPYSRYGWFKRWMMKRIVAKAGGDTDTSRDYVYTDWDELRAFAVQFVHQLRRRVGSEPGPTGGPARTSKGLGSSHARRPELVRIDRTRPRYRQEDCETPSA